MGLRMNMTKTTLEVDGWDLDVIIRTCDESLNYCAGMYERSMEEYGRDIMDAKSVWKWNWDLASKCHEANRRIMEEIQNR